MAKTKEALIEWYGQDFTAIDNEEALKVFLKEYFDSEWIDGLSLR